MVDGLGVGNTYGGKPKARKKGQPKELATVTDARLLSIEAGIEAALSVPTALAIIEDLPTGGMGAGLTGMAQGVIRLVCQRRSVPYALVVPSTLKKWATGNGGRTTDKAAMRRAFYAEGNPFGNADGIDGNDDNQVDAWWLRSIGLAYLGQSPVAMNDYRLEVLTDIVSFPAIPLPEGQ